MRRFLLFVGWSSVIGSIADLAIALFAFSLVLTSSSYGWSLSSDTLFQVHLPLIYWVKQLAYYLFHDQFVTWIFNLPAIGLFTFRAIVSTLIGGWALKKARSYESIQTNPDAS